MFDEDIKYDGFTLKEWNDALYDYCNGPQNFCRLAHINSEVKNRLVFLMKKRAEESKKLDIDDKNKIISISLPDICQNKQNNSLSIESQIKSWQTFYENAGIGFNPSNIIIPQAQKGFEMLIIMAFGLKPQLALDICHKMFKCREYSNNFLSKTTIMESRNPSQMAYAIWTIKNEEPDEDLADISPIEIYRNKIDCMTLTERLTLGAKYFSETGRHLDRRRVTLCVGSHRSGVRFVPSVTWSNSRRELAITWRSVESHHDYWCARKVVV